MENVISKSPKDAQPNCFINSLASLYFVLTGNHYALFISPKWTQNTVKHGETVPILRQCRRQKSLLETLRLRCIYEVLIAELLQITEKGGRDEICYIGRRWDG